MTRYLTGLSIMTIAAAFFIISAVSMANACPGNEQGMRNSQGKGYLFAMGAKGSGDKGNMPNSSKSGQHSDMDKGSFDQGNRTNMDSNRQNYNQGTGSTYDYDRGTPSGTMNRSSDMDRGNYDKDRGNFDKDRGSYDKDRSSFDRDRGTGSQGMSNQGSTGELGATGQTPGSSSGSASSTGGSHSSGSK